MFSGCINLKNINLSSFNTENVINMEGMFGEYSNFSFLNLSSLELTKDIEELNGFIKNQKIIYFDGCKNLENLNLVSSFKTHNVINMMYMFAGCNNLKNLNLPSSFNTHNVTNMMNMFAGCNNLKNLNLPYSFNTQNVTNMNGIFYGCKYFDNFNLSSFYKIDKNIMLKYPK